MDFVFAGQYCRLAHLSAELDDGFLRLHGAFSGGPPYDLGAFQSLVHNYLNNNAGSPDAQDLYFNNFTILWQSFLQNRNYDYAEGIWRTALEPVFSWEKQNPGSFVHKGTPFYFWGMTAVLRGHIDRGYALMHQALQEDIRTTGEALPEKPGFFFAILDFERQDQAFRTWVLQKAQYLERSLEQYRNLHNSTLSLEQVRTRFLRAPNLTEAVFLLGHVIARLIDMERIPHFALESPFAAQLQANVLFDLILVIDTGIRHRNPGSGQFLAQAEYLASKTGAGLSQSDLQSLNQQFIQDFEGTLGFVLDQTLQLPGGKTLTGLGSDIAVSYGLRNRSAHDPSSSRLVRVRFPEVRQAVFNTLFAVADSLY